MKTTNEYLDLIQKHLCLRSDNAIAKSLGVSRQCISNYRSGRGSFEDAVAQRAAEILGIHAGIVILDSHTERTKNDDIRSLWQEIAKGFHSLSLHAKTARGAALIW